jgi:hypothetical protein
VIDELFQHANRLDIDAITSEGLPLPEKAAKAVEDMRRLSAERWPLGERTWPIGRRRRRLSLAGINLDPTDPDHRRMFRDAALWVIYSDMWRRGTDPGPELANTSDCGSVFYFTLSADEFDQLGRRLTDRGIDFDNWVRPAREVYPTWKGKR